MSLTFSGTGTKFLPEPKLMGVKPFPLIAALLALCAIAMPAQEPTPEDRLAAAEAKWSANKPKAYEFYATGGAPNDRSTGCFQCSQHNSLMYVRNRCTGSRSAGATSRRR